MAACALLAPPGDLLAQAKAQRLTGTRIKLGLNAFSFNGPLRAGKMTMDDVIDFCAKTGIDGLDPTGYYFPGYPAAPSDAYLAALKKRSFLNGVTLNCTGIKQDFAVTDPAARQKDIQLVKTWVEVAQKLGASGLRVFSGIRVPEGKTFEQTLAYMVPAFQECCDYAGQRGVVIALQHHNDFLKTAAETIRLMEAVQSEWFGLVLDVGSVRQGDPYAEIEKLVPYACTWQLKENVYRNGQSEPVDLPKIKAIIDQVGYRGFVPFEALQGGGSPAVIAAFFHKIREGLGLA
jgi:sugar phosphate isomerase/epimerase